MQEQFDLLAELQVRRKLFIKAANRQTNAAGAVVRRALGWNPNDDEEKRKKINNKAARIAAKALAGKGCELTAVAADLEIFGQSIAPFTAARRPVELEMRRIARKLPIWEWAESVRGLGDLGLAVIIAETNDLALYSNPAKVWKRLGLAPYEGRAASTWRGIEHGLTSEEWKALGYSPRRRAEIFSCVGDPLFRQQTMINGPYRQAYDKRRAHTAITHSDWSKGHSHNDALRIMTKELIRDLWVAWRQATSHVKSIVFLPAADIPSQEERQADQKMMPTGTLLGAIPSPQGNGSAAISPMKPHAGVPPPELSVAR